MIGGGLSSRGRQMTLILVESTGNCATIACSCTKLKTFLNFMWQTGVEIISKMTFFSEREGGGKNSLGDEYSFMGLKLG